MKISQYITNLKEYYSEETDSGAFFHILPKSITKSHMDYKVESIVADKNSPSYNELDDIPIKNSIGYKYVILIHNPDELNVFSAILGDPYTFIANHIHINDEGIIMKYTKRNINLVKQFCNELIEDYYEYYDKKIIIQKGIFEI